MTVEPLIAYAEDTGIKIIDLNVICPTVDVTTGPTPPPGGGGAGVLLLGLVLIGAVMTSKKR